ncbi:unnamed protein product [Litomosoides sigmodontis]|uniref:Uncharacterized protein n=1 Tax=Litomosoides sigmodontis TaxID=42156 RepID=A0A3P6UWE8_LITSI|nr:unnamed protein product [Litomosoides sigmodontis]
MAEIGLICQAYNLSPCLSFQPQHFAIIPTLHPALNILHGFKMLEQFFSLFPMLALFAVCSGRVDAFGSKRNILSSTQRGTDYGAAIIKGSAGIVIAVSLALIFLVIGNMVYQTLTRKVALCEKRKY